MNCKITAVFPNRLDGTSYYRGAGVFNELSRAARSDGDHVVVNSVHTIGWADITDSEIFFIQRPFRNCDLQMIRLAKQCGLKVWVDYDDLLLSVPPENPCYATYRDAEKYIVPCLREADYLTVSTQDIGIGMGGYVTKVNSVRVIPNAWNFRLFPHRQKFAGKHPRILWRGTNSHVKDLYEVKDQIWELAAQHPEWEWTFLGFRPFYLDGLPNSTFHDTVDVFTYLRFIESNSFDACIVPLCANPFNRAKSNIAWLEATAAGALTVAPPFPEWDQPGVIRYNAFHHFGRCVEEVVEQSNDRFESVRAYVKDRFNLEQANKIRLEIINQLLAS